MACSGVRAWTEGLRRSSTQEEKVKGLVSTSEGVEAEMVVVGAARARVGRPRATRVRKDLVVSILRGVSLGSW